MKTWWILALLMSPMAHAFQDVTCWDGDCLANGWSRQDGATPTYTDYQCYRDGCTKSGWIAGGNQGVNHYTQCKDGGCFKAGWWEVDRQTQNLNATVTCLNNDCLKFGWLRSTTVGTTQITCRSNNCHRDGWSGSGPDPVSAYCKPKGCFKEGWVEN